MTFVVSVATDLGQGKVNTGVDFGTKPQSLQPLFATINELYTAERQSLLKDKSARFSTVLGLIMSRSGNQKEKWAELTSHTQLYDGCQIYVFDGDSPPPERGVIPKASVIVHSNLVTNPRMASVTNNFQTPSSRTPSTQHDAIPSETHLPSDRRAARAFLFEELCAQSEDFSSFPAQALHSILVQNEMFFSTSDFSQMTRHRQILNRPNWDELCEEFTPVVDVLYDRIATKSRSLSRNQSAKDKEQVAKQLRDQLDELEDEEAALLARQAELREKKSKVRRLLGTMEAEAKAEKDDRSKEWDVVCKFVSLRLRQEKLREENSSIAHQLSLL
jgi:hypothetical protein